MTHRICETVGIAVCVAVVVIVVPDDWYWQLAAAAFAGTVLAVLQVTTGFTFMWGHDTPKGGET